MKNNNIINAREAFSFTITENNCNKEENKNATRKLIKTVYAKIFIKCSFDSALPRDK